MIYKGGNQVICLTKGNERHFQSFKKTTIYLTDTAGK